MDATNATRAFKQFVTFFNASHDLRALSLASQTFHLSFLFLMEDTLARVVLNHKQSHHSVNIHHR